MSKTKIEYVDLTINPMVGCSKCSPGCDNCYAERMAARLSKNPLTAAKYAGVVDANGKWTGKINVDLSCFDKLPKKTQRIFVGSMTDIFHEDVDLHTIEKILNAMKMYGQHTFLTLSKRADEVQDNMLMLADKPLPNLWLGVTVCNQQEADEKIPLLLQTPAAKRFVSIEPMLGAVNLTQIKTKTCTWDTLADYAGGEKEGPSLDWVICGGETGPGARPMHPDWVRSLRDQCHSAEVPFFFKGMIENGKKTRLLDGREWNEVPE